MKYKSFNEKLVFSVSDFVAVFNQTIDYAYPEVVVVGELSNLRVSKGSWLYFDLKDESANIKFFGTIRMLPGPVENGLMLEVTGRPYLHPQFGFSINASSINISGEGSINKAYKLLEQKLIKEGLFSVERKRPLAYPPSKVGLITSKESAAYGDFMKIINKRWPRLEIEIFDTLVQGKDAPDEIISAIIDANNTLGLEALIIIRGGGGRDDLAAFDHEQVVRAIASSRVPTLVAIGHERDVVLSELVADMRASTPSNAAEILVPDKKDELHNVAGFKKRIEYLLNSLVVKQKLELNAANQDIDKRLAAIIEGDRLLMNKYRQILKLTHPKALLQKGYILAQDSKGNYVKSAKIASKLDNLQLTFKDGKIEVKV